MTDRNAKPPVAWLFGPQLIASLKGTALYLVFGEKLDPKDWMRPKKTDFSEEARDGEFWFDYIADSGDGQTATYAIAYLCLSDLWTAQGAALPGDQVATQPNSDTPFALPRGHFLFVGGDTAYHVSDARTLKERIQKPFAWAAEDLALKGSPPDERHLFGIPGNHDYYDSIDGFNRIVRRPFNEEDPDLNLSVAGFVRTQEASYVGVQLPFDWWFFGMDTQGGDIDKRQRHFFRQILASSPKQLVVATPEPSTVFGQRKSPDSLMAKTFDDLGLERPFLEGAPEVAAGSCRLDLSGDIHHYARYGGDSGESKLPRGRYASVVSGLGGAFLHSSHTDFGEVPAERLYPDPEVARDATAARILNPLVIARGGYVWLVGALAAALVYFNAGVPDSGRQLFGVSELPPQGGLFAWLHENVFRVAPDLSPPAMVQSLLFALAIGASVGLLVAASRVRDWIDEEPTRPTEWAYLLIALCWIGIVGLPYVALWGFGRHSAAVLFTDIGLLLPLALYLVGLPLMAWKVGGGRHGLGGKIGLLGLGIIHGLAQLLVPYLLASRLHWLPLLVAPVLMAGCSLLLYLGVRLGWRFWLPVIFATQTVLHVVPSLVFFEPRAASEIGLAASLLLGSIVSCVLFGQYLAAAMVLGAHNNEAGGAARIERFKQMIRFRLREENGVAILRAWVIAVDDPRMPGHEMTPRIVDCFEIRAD